MLTLPVFEEAVMISRRRAADDVAAQNVSWRVERSAECRHTASKKSMQDYGDVRITAVEEPEPSYEETPFGIEEESSVAYPVMCEYGDSVEDFGVEESAPGGGEPALDEVLSEGRWLRPMLRSTMRYRTPTPSTWRN